MVVLRLPNGTGPYLRAYLLDTWKELAVTSDDRTIEDLEDFVYDLRQKLVADRSSVGDGFFDAIGDLSIGPLRTSEIGSCRLDHFDKLSFLAPLRAGELTLLPEDTIKQLIGTIRGL